MDRPDGRAPEPGPDPLSAAGTGNGAGRADWEAAAASVLRRAGRLAADDPDDAAWSRLARSTIDGVTIAPLGTPASPTDLPPIGDPGVAPFVRGSVAPTGAGWDIRAWVADTVPMSAAGSLLAELENGATSVWLTVGAAGTSLDDLPTVLHDVLTDLAAVVLHPVAVSDIDAAQKFCSILATRASSPAVGTSLGADPVSGALRSGSVDRAAVDSRVVELAGLAAGRGIGALVVDGTAAHETGGGEVGELSWSLAVGAHYLRVLTAAGLDIDGACRLIDFRYAATVDQFPTIAKLRAARLLWHRVTELSGASAPARAQRQHAVTSRPMTTRYDPWVNMLRTTVAAFAAGVGGAQAITVLPFDAALGVPEEFGRRIGRNISTLLIDESHVAAVADPAGGAHAVEALTASLAEAAWADFGRTERAGGVLAALADGSVRSRLTDIGRKRASLIARRRIPITGVSEFPHAGEVLPPRRGWPVETGWDGVGWADPFERLRDRPATRPVYLVTLGDLAAHSTRAGFITNLLAAGGIAVLPSGPVRSAAEASASFDRGATTVVLLAGADDSYGALGVGVVGALRDAGATAVFAAGKLPRALADVTDGSVALGDDVLDFLGQLRSALQAAVVPS